ncbi:MAG: DJ-1 family glyoxalase III [Myxococcota bacterium]
MKKRVLVPLAPGFEEVEALTVVDYLRRADCHVVTASVGAPNPIAGRSKIRVMSDIDIDEAVEEWGDAWDAIVVPGGEPGVTNLMASATVVGLVQRRLAAGGLTAAICAGPKLLVKAGLAAGVALTSYPGVRAELEAAGHPYKDDTVVVDGAVITSRGPGTAVAFALALVEALFGAAKAAEIRQSTVS